MLVKAIDLRTKKDILKEIEYIVLHAASVEKEFSKLTEDVFIVSGHPTEMLLVWGVTRGQVIKQSEGSFDDFLGHHVNKAARLCDLARPDGMVFDRDDFLDAPQKYRSVFYEQTMLIQKLYQEV